jgi:DNA topoisomerase-1
LQRIRKLAIPPAWSEVWICPLAEGHLQATGRDEKNRKQYLYHPTFRTVRDEAKFAHMLEFVGALPTIRAVTEEHLSLAGLPREKVLATTVQLLESTLIRVGNGSYAKQNGSFGLTTLRGRHVGVEGSELRFRFKGKSGKLWRIKVKDRRLAKIVRQCQNLPGQQLLEYQDESGAIHNVTSSDVNAYLKDITGQEITAKDFRTWAGTVLAAATLNETGASDTKLAAKKNVNAAIRRVAAQLGNTAAICRKCYVHPAVLQAYLGGTMAPAHAPSPEITGTPSQLKPEEVFTLTLLMKAALRAG